MNKLNTINHELSWREAVQNKKFIIYSIASFILLISMIYNISNFINWVEMRPGVVLNDPILNLFMPVDVTWYIFILLHIFSTWALIVACMKPQSLILGVLSYSFMVYLRLLTMWLLALDPPKDIIIMHNPFMLLIGVNANEVKDLFFSGHTATLFIAFFVVRQRWLKWVMLVAAILIGAGVLLQHVHYTVDVVAAPVFAYASYRVARFLNNYIFGRIMLKPE
jgi:membrane-associated phospholipid phosphatase